MTTRTEDEVLLNEYFERGAYLRVRDNDPLLGRHGGVELRFVVSAPSEKREVIKALQRLEVRHGRIYQKRPGTHRWVIPIYTRRDVIALLKAVRPTGYTAMVRRVLESAIRPLQAPRKRR